MIYGKSALKPDLIFSDFWVFLMDQGWWFYPMRFRRERRRHLGKLFVWRRSGNRTISGGIKNALDRGESLSKAKQTFINAGYTPQEVQAATQMIKSKPSQITKPLKPDQPNPTQPTTPQLNLPQPNPTQSKTPEEEKNQQGNILIITAIIGIIILVTALFLGLFWDKIFS